MAGAKTGYCICTAGRDSSKWRTVNTVKALLSGTWKRPHYYLANQSSGLFLHDNSTLNRDPHRRILLKVHPEYIVRQFVSFVLLQRLEHGITPAIPTVGGRGEHIKEGRLQ